VFDEFGDRRDIVRELYSLKKRKDIPITKTDEELMLMFQDRLGFFDRSIKGLKKGFFKGCITESDFVKEDDGNHVSVGGIVSDVSVIRTKNDELMAFVEILDMDEKIEVTVFPKEFEKYSEVLAVGLILRVDGFKGRYKQKHTVEAKKIIRI
jgi:DNA polymerase-3 subunit alpha